MSTIANFNVTDTEATWCDALVGLQDPFTLQHPVGSAYTFVGYGGYIEFYRTEIEDPPMGALTAAIADGQSSKPWVFRWRGLYGMARQSGDNIVVGYAKDYWTTWGTDAVIYSDATQPAVLADQNGLWLWVFAYRAGAIVVRRTAGWTGTLETFADGTTEKTVLAAGADDYRPAPWQSKRDGSLYVDIAVSGAIRRYHSKNGGNTWAEVVS